MLYANTAETALNEELFQLVSKKIVGLRLSPVAFFAIRLLVVAVVAPHDSHDDPSRTWPPTVLERLAPETLELLDSAHVTHTKGVATQREVRLGGGAARL